MVMTDLLPVPEIGGENAISQTDGRLAWEIAAEIAPIPDIIHRYGMTPADFKKKLQNPMFRGAVREAKSLWKSDLNVQQRIRLKAAYLVEDSLLDVFKIMKDEKMGSAARLEAFEKLLKSADLTPKAKDGSGGLGTGFRVNIILGDNPGSKVVIDGHALPAPVSAE